jgi:hypothetical protein
MLEYYYTLLPSKADHGEAASIRFACPELVSFFFFGRTTLLLIFFRGNAHVLFINHRAYKQPCNYSFEKE